MDEITTNRFAGDKGFKDKVLLITGATGFLGKVLIEKILRTCPLVKTIYVLVRPKKGKSAEERLEDMFSSPLFDLLKQIRGDVILNKVIAVNGDVFQEDLQLSPGTSNMLREEVQIIYHMAATVRFDEPFKKTVLMNTRGTKYMLSLARECKRLLVFAYVSTAYCHLEEKVLFEKAYPPPADPNTVIKFIETTDEVIVEALAKKIMGDCPYAYSFSKALAEDLVNDEMDQLPVIILRPSVVIPIWKDPIPGWTDNLNGPTGIFLAGGKGLLRIACGNPKMYGDYLPVDIIANLTIVATYDYINHRTRRFYNLTSSSEIKVTFEELIETCVNKIIWKVPLNWVLWVPNVTLTTSRLLYNIYVVFFHYIPALGLDLLIVLAGKSPIMWRIQRKISKGGELVSFYSSNQWKFNNDNVLEIRKYASEDEKKVYQIDSDGFDVKSYMYQAARAVRLYILKETDETLPTAHRHLNIMWAIDKFCKCLFLVGCGYLMQDYVLDSIVGTYSMLSELQ